MILVQRALGEGRGVLGGHEEECPVRKRKDVKRINEDFQESGLTNKPQA